VRRAERQWTVVSGLWTVAEEVDGGRWTVDGRPDFAPETSTGTWVLSGAFAIRRDVVGCCWRLVGDSDCGHLPNEVTRLRGELRPGMHDHYRTK